MIEIDDELCTGCRLCLDVCPCDVIYFNDESEKAYPKYNDECWYCGSCTIECPSEAIKLLFPYLKR